MNPFTNNRITSKDVKRVLHNHNYYVNSHYMSNIIAIRNNHSEFCSFQDTLFVFCNDGLNTDYHDYTVTTTPNKFNLSSKEPLADYMIKEGQYINALQLNKTTGTPTALIPIDEMTLINSTFKNEKTNIFSLAIQSMQNSDPSAPQKWAPASIIFENKDEFLHFISLCKIASRFNNNRFTLTIINLSEFYPLDENIRI